MFQGSLLSKHLIWGSGWIQESPKVPSHRDKNRTGNFVNTKEKRNCSICELSSKTLNYDVSPNPFQFTVGTQAITVFWIHSSVNNIYLSVSNVKYHSKKPRNPMEFCSQENKFRLMIQSWINPLFSQILFCGQGKRQRYSCSMHHAVKAYGGVEVKHHAFLSSAADEFKWWA